MLKKEIIKYTHLQDRVLLLCQLVNESQFNTLSSLEAVEEEEWEAAVLAVIVTAQLEN